MLFDRLLPVPAATLRVLSQSSYFSHDGSSSLSPSSAAILHDPSLYAIPPRTVYDLGSKAW